MTLFNLSIKLSQNGNGVLGFFSHLECDLFKDHRRTNYNKLRDESESQQVVRIFQAS
jgi:hypothetical protein